jgi:hypothetical protein
VIGPTGVGLGPNGTLYVADTLGNRVAAIPAALYRGSSAGTGSTLTRNGALNGGPWPSSEADADQDGLGCQGHAERAAHPVPDRAGQRHQVGCGAGTRVDQGERVLG